MASANEGGIDGSPTSNQLCRTTEQAHLAALISATGTPSRVIDACTVALYEEIRAKLTETLWPMADVLNATALDGDPTALANSMFEVTPNNNPFAKLADREVAFAELLPQPSTDFTNRTLNILGGDPTKLANSMFEVTPNNNPFANYQAKPTEIASPMANILNATIFDGQQTTFTNSDKAFDPKIVKMATAAYPLTENYQLVREKLNKKTQEIMHTLGEVVSLSEGDRKTRPGQRKAAVSRRAFVTTVFMFSFTGGGTLCLEHPSMTEVLTGPLGLTVLYAAIEAARYAGKLWDKFYNS